MPMAHHEDQDTAPGTFTNPGPLTWGGGQMRAAIAAVVLLLAAGLWTLRPFLPALGWGTILAVSLWPWYQRRAAGLAARWGWAGRPWMRRLVMPGVVTCLVALAFILPLAMVVSALHADRMWLVQGLAQAQASGIPAPAMLHGLPEGDRIAAWWAQNLGQPGWLGHFSAGRLGQGGKVVGEVARRALVAGFTLLALFFLLRDGDRVALAARLGSRRAFGPAGENVGAQLVAAIRGTVNGLVVVGFGEGLIMGIAYEIAGVPHPALFALLTALLSVVPLGSMLAIAAAAGLALAAGDIGAGIAVFAVGAVVVFIADHFVRPVLIGEATRLPFLWVLLGILGGIEAWGLIGLVLGPALMAALMLLWREWTGAQQGPLNGAPEEYPAPAEYRAPKEY